MKWIFFKNTSKRIMSICASGRGFYGMFIFLSLCSKMVNTLAVSTKVAFGVKWIPFSSPVTWAPQITVPEPANWIVTFTPVYTLIQNIKGYSCSCSCKTPCIEIPLANAYCGLPCAGDSSRFCGGLLGITIYRSMFSCSYLSIIPLIVT